MIINALNKYQDIHLNTSEYSIPYIINFSIKNMKRNLLLAKLEQHEVYLSANTSCCPENTPSKLVYAYTHDKTLASSSIRLSLSHMTTKEEVINFLNIFNQCYQEIYYG